MRAAIALILALACAPAAASTEATGWLMKINDAARELNYTGTFVYVQGSRIESMRVTHRLDEDSMRQRIYALNGAPREVIRDAEHVWCYVPDKKLGVHEYRQVTRQGFPNLLPEGLEALTRHYDVYIGVQGRVAERVVQQIMVAPKDEFRYGYDLWADLESGLLLKAALLDEEMRPIEQYLFTDVEIGGDIPSEALDPMTPKSELVWYGDARESDGDRGQSGEAGDMPAGSWEAADMPDGFELTRRIKRHSPMRSGMVEHYVYSDGLASVSVFVEELDEGSSVRISGINRMGAVHAFGRVVNDHQVTVVGEVPSETVDLIGNSVQPKTQ